MKILSFSEWYQQQVLKRDSLNSYLIEAIKTDPTALIMLGEELGLIESSLHSPKIGYYFYTLVAQARNKRDGISI